MLTQLKVVYHFNSHCENKEEESELAIEKASNFLRIDYSSGDLKKEMLENCRTDYHYVENASTASKKNRSVGQLTLLRTALLGS